jgi:hypothetical protein
MKKQNLQNEKLDRIGGELLKAARLPDEEIEKIILGPQLFDSVKRRIEAERLQKTASFFTEWANSGVWTWQKVAVPFAVLAVLITGAVSLLIFTKQSSPDITMEIQPQAVPVNVSPHPDIVSDPVEFRNPPSSVVKTPALLRRSGPENKSIVKTRSVKRQPRTEREEVGEFYALTYAGDPEESEDAGQIVRVDLPRASLFAMGINIPVENESAKIKTDLLISSDGVTRAVRLVKTF